VLVGRYTKPGTGTVAISGKIGDQQQQFDFPVNFVEHSDDQSQSFIEKLWAVRRVGEILDEIDLKGKNDELVKELVSLSLKHGIMTPYTSFLADENSTLHDVTKNMDAAGVRLSELSTNADGKSGVDQRAAKHAYQMANQPAAAAPMTVSGRNGFGGGAIAADSGTGQVSALGSEALFGSVAGAKDDADKVAQNVRQIGRKAFYRHGDRWVDSAVTPELEKKTVKVNRFSPEYFELIDEYGKDAAKYLATDEPITVELGGQAYEILEATGN
jgi:Ca-activated chloride channel homolog